MLPSAATELSILAEELQNDPLPVGICYQLAFRGSESFYKAHGRWPGADTVDADIRTDTMAVGAEIQKIYHPHVVAEADEEITNATLEMCVWHDGSGAS